MITPTINNPKQQPSLLTYIALFLGAITPFINLYATQPILPLIQADFGISLNEASLTLSAIIFTVAIISYFYGPLSDRFGRKPVIVTSTYLLSLPTLALFFIHNYLPFVILRALQGIFIPGITVLLITYIMEEYPQSKARIIGLYLAFTIAGGLGGRMLTGYITQFLPWEDIFPIFAAITLTAALLMHFFLPPSRRFRPRPISLESLSAFLPLLRNGQLRINYFLAFGNFFNFVAIFTYLPFRLMQAPFNLSLAQASFLFLFYGVGMVASPLAGRFSERFSKERVMIVGLTLSFLGITLTAFSSIYTIILGLILLCLGMFTTHAAASAQAGELVPSNRSSAIALYQVFYYTGGAVGATLPAILWLSFGWQGVLIPNLLLLILGIFFTTRSFRKILQPTMVG